MKNTIHLHLEKLQKSIDWVNGNLNGEKKKLSYSRLVTNRGKLKKIADAMGENPAAAVYGESQVGKSYLVSGLLSTPEQRFCVSDANGRNYDFINEINPIGGQKEATGLVTRFSLHHKSLNNQYPIKIKILSIVDVVLILCDAYYNDSNSHKLINSEDLNKEINKLVRSKEGSNTIQQVIEEDDVVEIKNYFDIHFKSKNPYLECSDYFEKISLTISLFEPAEWPAVFSILWNKNKCITDIFSKLIQKFKEIEFVAEAHIPYSAVLREFGTLLDVARLNEINPQHAYLEANYTPETPICYIDRNDNKVEKNVSKSYLCAIVAELIFKLPENLKESKPFLEKTDLLDFPGARARMEIYESNIKDELIPQMLLRGKVAYLFNKYCSSYKINTLLFCHGKNQSVQRLMPELLNRWIENFIGSTPEKRQAFITTSKLPPLFVIGTMFNLDLKYEQNDKKGNSDALNNRWSQRFSIVLEKEIFNCEIYDWLKNWTTTDKYFRNIYLLRDFYYSSELQNQLYEGYNSDKQEIKEIIPFNYPDFRIDLKDSFLNYDFVKKHFLSPEESWSRSAGMNQDGTGLIIENLSIAAMNINVARNEKFVRELAHIKNEITEELEKHYHSKNSDIQLLKAKEMAGNIQLKLDAKFGEEFFFSNLIKNFLITEGEIYNFYRNKLRSIEIDQNINIEKYSAIRLNTPNLSLTNDFDTNLEILRKAYEKSSLEQCRLDFEKEGINLHELFYGNKNRIKNYSKTLAEELEAYWFDQCLKVKLYTNLQEVFSESEIGDITTMLRSLFHKLHLVDRIAESIRKYVDRYDKIEDVQEMIADISAEIINKFVNTIGFAYFTEERIVDIRTANVNKSLGLELNHDALSHETFTTENVAELFDVLDKLPDLLNEPQINQDIVKNIPRYSNYKKWRDLLKLGFISVCDIPNYDIEANERLGTLMKEYGDINYTA
ncbi:hypothetical protein A4H97_16485 [Niastella yeongjuensis]|uniref:Virulence factor n=1 Tax=Niastella yeongjuensis TaxID=354355 RepID=A0A1V9E110_9BACT|nr:virulence factor SrfC family protein [Niastella yeongjuensis]OQP39818.1 hypothetical protein A4H97_16485 [Niastella yeongjuensis]SEO06506.1 Putative virulence factor [Niastella yeongjuensis]